MKIKLPSLPRLGRGAAPTTGPGGTMTAEPAVIGSAGDRMRLVARRLRGAAGYVFLFFVVFCVFVWVSLPTRAIAWRIGQAARDAGYIVEVEDLSISPLGNITLYNVTWTFQPSHAGQIPRKLELPEVDVDVGVLGLLFGNYHVEIDTKIDEATIHAAYSRSADESKVVVNVAELPLYDVPKLQQSVNSPVAGLFALDVDLTLPDNQFSKAVGSISLQCSSCTIGDGETLLYVPGAGGLLAKGVTLPAIDLGSLGGRLVVADGKAVAEKFETASDDIALKITGEMVLADPFSKSEFAFDLKLLITPALQDRSEPLKLLVQTAGASTKLDPPEQDWLGFKMRGNAGRPRFMGIKTKSREERERETRQKKLENEAKRKARKAKKDRDEKNTPTPTTPDGADGGMGLPPVEAGQDPAGARPEDVRPEDSKPADAKPEDVRPTDSAEGKPEDSKPADVRPVDENREPQPEDSKPVAPPEEKPEVGENNDAREGEGGAGQGGGENAPPEGAAPEGGAAPEEPPVQ